MNRRNFMGKSLFAGIGCSCVSALNANSLVPIPSDKTTPCADKANFAKIWAERFFNVLDEHVDKETREKIMRHNGRLCHNGGKPDIGELKPKTYEEIDTTIREFHKWAGDDNPRRENNTIFFHYVGNPKGLKIADGYCLCPLIEDGPTTISPTFCQCSAGYVEQMFREITGRNVKVELLESLRSGGKSCRFKIEMI